MFGVNEYIASGLGKPLSGLALERRLPTGSEKLLTKEKGSGRGFARGSGEFGSNVRRRK